MSEPTPKENFSFIEMLGAHPGKFALGGLVAVILVWGFYLGQFRFGLSDSQEIWGQFGDFVGGTLNSVFGFFGFLILLSSLRLQAKELEETRKELRASSEAQKMQAEHFEREAKKKDHTDAINYLCTGDLIEITGTKAYVTRFTSPNSSYSTKYETIENPPNLSEIEDADLFRMNRHNLKFIKEINKVVFLDKHCHELYTIFPLSPVLINPIEKFESIAIKLSETGWITDLKFFGKHDFPIR